ncbi:hypothetical protein ACPW7O_31635, partial [Streptomyces tunisiensis]
VRGAAAQTGTLGGPRHSDSPVCLPRPYQVPGSVSEQAGAAAAAGVACAYRRWRGPGPEPLRLAETSAGLMLSAFLVSRPSYNHYLLVVLPLLLAGLPYAGSVTRRPWFWLALVPQLPGVTWPWLESGKRRAFRDAVTLCVLAGTVAYHAVRGARDTRDAGDEEGAGRAADGRRAAPGGAVRP